MRLPGTVMLLLLVACGPHERSISAAAGAAAGTVLDDGKPAPGITLTLIGPHGSYNVRTDASGSWSAGNLPPGEYWFYYQNPKADLRVAYWKGPRRNLEPGGSLQFGTIDIGHRGTPREPADGARVNMPAIFEWTPYPGARDYGFQVVDRAGRESKVLFRPVKRFDSSTTRIVYDGGINVQNVPHLRLKDYLGEDGDFLPPGTYAWHAVWSTEAGEGHGAPRAFTVVATRPEIFPKTMDPPDPPTGNQSKN